MSIRNFISIIFAALLVLSFTDVESFAFSNPWKNANPKCKKYDFRCKRLSKKMTEEEAKQIIEKTEIQTAKKSKITDDIKNDRNESYSKCKKYDFRCKRLSKKVSNDSNTELNIFTGQFDFSDHKQKAGVIGLQHQNEDLFRQSFMGKLSPITGGFLTENNAFYLYTGVQAEYEFGNLKITPSFAPGYYNYGNGKDLGYPLEFKTEVQMSFEFSEDTHLGMSYNHISNASLGTKNPGANSYMINFLKQF